MHRFFVPAPAGYEVGQRLALPAERAHQVRSVLRMAPGDGVIVLDDAGFEYEAALVEVGRSDVTVEIVAKRPSAGEPTVHISLYQSLLKKDNFEWVLQKGTELGVSRFVPLLTARTVAAFRPQKMARWQRIVMEAAEQSRRGRIPVVAAALPLAAALPAGGCALLAWEETADLTIAQALAGRSPSHVALFIGPEGGFALEEAVLAQQHGVASVTLGRRILRAETAAVAAITLLLAHFAEM